MAASLPPALTLSPGGWAQVLDDHSVIGRSLFKKETNIQLFVGLRVQLSTGELGVIDSAFGQSGKFKVHVPGECGNFLLLAGTVTLPGSAHGASRPLPPLPCAQEPAGPGDSSCGHHVWSEHSGHGSAWTGSSGGTRLPGVGVAAPFLPPAGSEAGLIPVGLRHASAAWGPASPAGGHGRGGYSGGWASRWLRRPGRRPGSPLGVPLRPRRTGPLTWERTAHGARPGTRGRAAGERERQGLQWPGNSGPGVRLHLMHFM